MPRIALGFVILSLLLSLNSAAQPGAPVTDSGEVVVTFSQLPPESLSQGVEISSEGLSLLGTEPGEWISEALDIPDLRGGATFIALNSVWAVINPNGVEVSYSFRVSVDANLWSAWTPFVLDDEIDEPDRVISGLHDIPRENRYFQYRVNWSLEVGQTPPLLTSARFIFFDAGISPMPLVATTDSMRSGYPKPPVVSRTAWGNPHGQNSPNWIPVYTDVSHIFVHHTATSNHMSDWAAQVRNVWNYHTNTLGWGDIGYNYLIDPNGVIYEGRAGGDNVRSGHAGTYNTNSMGISLLGCFHPTGCPNSPTTPTQAALNSLTELIAWKSAQRGIDPTLSSTHPHTGQYLPNVVGHRQAPGMSTVCPGDYVMSQLNNIRADAKARIGAQVPTPTPMRTATSTFTATMLPTVSQTPVPITLSVGDAAVLEGNTGQHLLNFPMTLSRASVSPIQVTYMTQDGTASTPSDYLSANGTLTIPAGQTSVTVSVVIVGDTLVEPNETFSLVIQNPVGAVIGRAIATGTLIDDDGSVDELLSGGDFENGMGEWRVRHAPNTRQNDRIRCAGVGANGSACAFTFIGDLGENTRLIYTINNPTTLPSDHLNLSFSYSSKVPAPRFSVNVQTVYSDGRVRTLPVIGLEQFSKTTSTNAPNYQSLSVWLPDVLIEEAPSKLQIIIRFRSPNGRLHLDNLSLRRYTLRTR
jgi:hypothetical protein